MEKMTAADLYHELVDRELFTSYELDLVITLNGLTIETLNDCIFARYGYRDLSQMLEEEAEQPPPLFLLSV